jgi:glycerol-3-phosphate dehydrogenase (NAD(P)+)
MPDRTPSAPDPAPPYGEIAVVGAGAWGTALAFAAASGGPKVTLWAREPEVVESIRRRRENAVFLPGIALPPGIEPTGDLADVGRAEAILLAAPAQHLRETLRVLAPHMRNATPIVLCAKGIETGTGKLLTEVLAEEAPHAEPAMLSGPSFARDVARGLPTIVSIAARADIAQRLQVTLGGAPGFRPYVTEDLTGVALGGAAKNVYAIGCGMVEGAGFGESARAGLLARSFAELLRLGAAMGIKAETLMGLSGLGDLVLTATSMSSRNFALGVHIGQGRRLADMLAPGQPLAEGAATAPALVARGERHGVELPVAHAVADVLAGRLDVAQAGERLLSRPFKAE